AVGNNRILERMAHYTMETSTPFEMDLADMQNSAEYNNDTNYLLTIIDVFSKYALVIPLQNKRGQSISEALEYIFRIKINNKPYKPMILLSDNGKEFIAKVKQLHVYYKYLNDKNNPIIPETIHFARGDKVRVQAQITPFIAPEQQRKLSAKTKSTVPNWSSEVYIVTKKIIDGKFVLYQEHKRSIMQNCVESYVQLHTQDSQQSSYMLDHMPMIIDDMITQKEENRTNKDSTGKHCIYKGEHNINTRPYTRNRRQSNH
ncbi:hypothetical protein PROFUN_16344, partial [Planoprotostelium fungivorum]